MSHLSASVRNPLTVPWIPALPLRLLQNGKICAQLLFHPFPNSILDFKGRGVALFNKIAWLVIPTKVRIHNLLFFMDS